MICQRCHQWNLTPIEDRWEALEECEAAFQKASVRASRPEIGIGYAPDGTQLVRIGAGASRSDIANWRYGKRLQRRRGRTLLAAALVGGIGLATLIIVGASTGSIVFTAWLAIFLIAWAWGLPESISWRIIARFRPFDGPAIAVRQSDLTELELVRGHAKRWHLVWRRKRVKRLTLAGPAAADFLAILLPRVNWHGGAPPAVEEAVALVDKAEGMIPEPGSSSAPPPWERILPAKPRKALLLELPPVQRLALEMAVTEDVELRSLKGHAGRFRPAWRAAERIAAIADTLLLPPFVIEWLERQRRGKGQDAPAA